VKASIPGGTSGCKTWNAASATNRLAACQQRQYQRLRKQLPDQTAGTGPKCRSDRKFGAAPDGTGEEQAVARILRQPLMQVDALQL